MRIKKEGLILRANGQREWMMSHIQVPYAYVLDDRIRVFFTTRSVPEKGMYRSNTAYLDLDREDINRIIEISIKPILELGKPGTFDEYGIMPGPIINMDNNYWMYYEGWSRLSSVPYAHAIGIAVSEDMCTFRKYSEGPILSDCLDEPYRLYSVVGDIKKDSNRTMHMYYGSGLGWEEFNGRMESIYLIRHAISRDGIEWKRDKEFLIEKEYEDECQAPGNIVKIDNKWHMFFSYRRASDFRNKERGYRIGHAESDDLIKWSRDWSFDRINVSDDGWDSEMICYPFVFENKGKYIMLYCGNGFGLDGFGYAYIDF